MSARILAVDDEPDLLELVRLGLSQAGYVVETARTGTEALAALRRAPPDLVVLDVMLPDLSGTELCARIRADQRLAAVPIIMLTAKSEEIDRVVGLEVGADDYVTKPFSPRELALRVRAVLRRRAPSDERLRVLEHSVLRVDPEAHRASVGGDEIVLTAKEFQLLLALMTRPGRVMTRERLLDEVWGSDITVTSRTIDTHLKRLREKLGAAGALVETVRGVGYRFAE
ncbi:MAG: response regulator [Deltaproteobacteria bacterium]|nr:response regulator [Deltaproteobacteria bacterium]